MAQAASSSFPALLKPEYVSPNSRNHFAFHHRRVILSSRRRYPSILVTNRLADTTPSTTSTTDSNGSTNSTLAIAKPKNVPPTISVGAVITVVRKQRPSRDEQMVNAVDVFSDFTGSRIFIQLVSAEVDPVTGVGKRSQESFIRDWAQKAGVVADKVQYTTEFRVGGEFGQPAALLIRNAHQAEFYLESIALQLESGTVYFPCHSYVAAAVHDPEPRVFFSNKVLGALALGISSFMEVR